MTRAKGTDAHYRRRIDRLRRRADYLRHMLTERPDRSEASKHHITAEISALDWAVSMLEPWFCKDVEPPQAAGAVPDRPTVHEPSPRVDTSSSSWFASRLPMRKEHEPQ